MTLPLELVERIVETPDDDGPRLVLADALQAAGDPRGEFIVVQCALHAAASSSPSSSPSSSSSSSSPPLAAGKKKITKTKLLELERIQKKLLAAHGLSWQAEAGFGNVSCEFRRGFIEKVELNRPLETIGELAWKMSPIRDLTLRTRAPFVGLAKHLIVTRLAALNLVGCEVTVADLESLPTANIGSLMLWNDVVDLRYAHHIGDEAAAKLKARFGKRFSQY